MSQTEGPQSEIGSCVGHTSKTILNGMNSLTNTYLTQVKLLEENTSLYQHKAQNNNTQTQHEPLRH